METIKNFFKGAWGVVKGVAKFAYDFFVAPVVNLKDIFSVDWGTKFVLMIEAAAKVTILASFFTAVSTFALVLAWIWVVLSLVFAAATVIVGMCAMGFFTELTAASCKAVGDAVDQHAANDATVIDGAATFVDDVGMHHVPV